MIQELDRVVLTTDLTMHGLRAGDVGTVVFDHNGKGYEVEFMTLTGETLAVATVTAEQVRAVLPSEISHAREIEVALSH